MLDSQSDRSIGKIMFECAVLITIACMQLSSKQISYSIEEDSKLSWTEQKYQP